jgi:hypothetical protein
MTTVSKKATISQKPPHGSSKMTVTLTAIAMDAEGAHLKANALDRLDDIQIQNPILPVKMRVVYQLTTSSGSLKTAPVIIETTANAMGSDSAIPGDNVRATLLMISGAVIQSLDSMRTILVRTTVSATDYVIARRDDVKARLIDQIVTHQILQIVKTKTTLLTKVQMEADALHHVTAAEQGPAVIGAGVKETPGTILKVSQMMNNATELTTPLMNGIIVTMTAIVMVSANVGEADVKEPLDLLQNQFQM